MDLPQLVVVSADHPSLEGAAAAFGAALRAETRYFGRRGERAARPDAVPGAPAHGPVANLRLAGLIDGDIVAMAAIDDEAVDGPELLIAVAEPWRGQGVALAIGREIVARATEDGRQRVVLRTCYRSSDIREAGDALGLETFDLGRGRLALVRRLDRQSA